MTNHATLLRQIRAEARPYIEQWLEIGEVFAGFRKLAADNDLDWGVIKALIKAEVQDEQDEEGGSKRVTKIIDKADCASAYADMLGLGGDEKNNFSSADLSPQSEINRRMTALWSAQLGKPLDQAIEEARADLPPHDEDGVIIEPSEAINGGSAAVVSEVGTGSSEVSAQLANVRPAPAPDLSDNDAQREATVKTTSPAPAAESPASSQEPCSHGSGAVQDRCESTAPPFPSDPGLSQASDGRLTEQETGDPVGSEAASADSLSSGKSPDPIAPIPGPVDEWADLDIPARFRRTAA